MVYSIQSPIEVHTWIGRVEPPLPRLTDVALGQALGAGSGLAAVASQRGADPTKLGAFARILAVGAMARDAAARFAPEITRLRDQCGLATSPGMRTLARERLYRLREAAATSYLFLLQEMSPAVVSLAMSLPPGSLGAPAPPEDIRRLAVAFICEVYQGFFDHLTSAASLAQTVASEDRIGAWERLDAHRCLFRMVKMESLAGSWTSDAPIRAIVKELEAFYLNRIPNVAHYFAVEGKLLDDPATGYPLFTAAQDVRAIRDHYLRFGWQIVKYGEGA